LPDVPYPITATDPKQAVAQMKQLIDELFQERIAALNIGDVFQAGEDDVLTLNLADSGGLEKSSSALTVKANGTSGAMQLGSDGIAVKADGTAGGTQINTAGVAVKPSPSKGLAIEAAGVYVVNTYIWPIGSVFIAVVATNPNTLFGYGTWTLLGTGDLTLT